MRKIELVLIAISFIVTYSNAFAAEALSFPIYDVKRYCETSRMDWELCNYRQQIMYNEARALWAQATDTEKRNCITQKNQALYDAFASCLGYYHDARAMEQIRKEARESMSRPFQY